MGHLLLWNNPESNKTLMFRGSVAQSSNELSLVAKLCCSLVAADPDDSGKV